MANLTSYKNFYLITFISTLSIIFNFISVAESISCYECSSLNDTHCPEFMSRDDSSIVAYNECSNVYQAAYCIKTTGVTGGTLGRDCFRCDETTDQDFACSDLLFGAKLQNCSDVFDAQYCIKATGMYGGSLGTRRFCSSRDMGNYCEYIRRPGDPHEYRSCVFTCSSDACNHAALTVQPQVFSITTTAFLAIIMTTSTLVL